MEIEINMTYIENNTCNEKEIQDANTRVNTLFRESMEEVMGDHNLNNSSSICYYVGISFDQNNENSE